MIQRLQSVWLLLSAALAALTFALPFYSGNLSLNGNFLNLTASAHVATLILTGVLIAGCVVIIFLYKNRKLQLRLTLLALFVSLLNIVIYFTQLSRFSAGNLSFAALITIAVPLFLFLAARGIWKDEKLIKSLDRLR